jgi:hypothetical protein
MNSKMTKSLQKLAQTKLEVEVWDYDLMKRNDYIGSFEIYLKDIIPSKGSDANEKDEWFRIPCFERFTNQVHFARIHLKFKTNL